MRLRNVMEMRLKELDQYSRDFNYVSRLFAKTIDETLPVEEQQQWQEEYSQAKLCMEQGHPMSYLLNV